MQFSDLKQLEGLLGSQIGQLKVLHLNVNKLCK